MPSTAKSATAPATGAGPRLLRALTGAVRRHRLLVILVLAYAAASATLKRILAPEAGGDGLGAMLASFAGMLPVMLYFALALRLLHMVSVVRPDNRAEWLKDDLTAPFKDPHRLADTGLSLALVIITLAAFAQMKGLIPVIHPYAWDATFAEIGRDMHFGVAPWRVLYEVLGEPLTITIFTGAYNFWLPLMCFLLFYACFARRKPRARMQFLLAFLLTWVLGGNVLATIFSSAGPAYFQRLGLGNEFVPLMKALADDAATAPISVLPVQNWLWGHYVRPEGLNGISAFPSIHVASSVLMALYGFRLSRAAGWALIGFAAVILLGSVLLAWHYAVDGYAGAGIALGCWGLAGWLLRRYGPGRTAAAG